MCFWNPSFVDVLFSLQWSFCGLQGFHLLLQGLAEVSDVENFQALDTKVFSLFMFALSLKRVSASKIVNSQGDL